MTNENNLLLLVTFYWLKQKKILAMT